MTCTTRLRKKADYEYTNYSIYFPDDWDWIENNSIIDIQYGNTINKEWTFEQSIDYPQYQLTSNNFENQ